MPNRPGADQPHFSLVAAGTSRRAYVVQRSSRTLLKVIALPQAPQPAIDPRIPPDWAKHLVIYELNPHTLTSPEGAGDVTAAAEGRPAEIMTPDLIAQILGVRAEVTPDPVTGTPMVIPIGRHGARLTQARVSR